MIRVNLQKPLLANSVLKKGFLASGLLLVLLISVLLNPERISLITCYLKEATGLSCLTCGLSRSLYAASHLHLQQSFGFHLMGPIIYFSLALLFLKFSYEAVARKEIRLKVNPQISRIALIMFASLWVGFWIIRFLGEL